MKNIFYFLLFSTLLLGSCDTLELIDGCKDPKPIELTENDKRWLTDSIQYFISENDTFQIRGGGFIILDKEGVINCKMPIQHKSSIQIDEISTKNLTVYLSIYKSPNETNIAYIFSKDTPNNLVVGVNQTMGMIDLINNRPAPPNGSRIIGEYLGNYTIRGREYTEVYKFTDLDESNIPEIDVASIIVSPMGFLRIEFYDGEVWERVIIE